MQLSIVLNKVQRKALEGRWKPDDGKNKKNNRAEEATSEGVYLIEGKRH